ncbi:hypothetical protein C8R45DRAFT_941532 [Mycena sanguinolenta]|nr:hypothetical protein C8R45DRAFT_941532 [Mycena sanguinolenta]
MTSSHLSDLLNSFRAASLLAAAPTLEDTRKAIDEEIVWHNTQIDSLKAKRNAMAPISGLPNELMTRVITIFAVDSNALFNLKWTEISRVCRHWRALSLAAHWLWVYIDNKNTRRYYHQLTRSGVAPLSLKLDIYGEICMQDILEHSKRVRKLDLTGAAKVICAFIPKLATHNFTVLSSLSLDLKDWCKELPADLVQALPDALFDGRLPLRKLKLTFIAFPSRLLSGLTALSLSQCNDSSTGFPPRFGEVLDMLNLCPQLVSLDLDQISAPLDERDYAVVHLAELDWLRLDGSDASITALLHHLCFPPQTKIRLSSMGFHSGNDVRDILVPIRTHTRRPGTETVLHLHIDRSSEHDIPERSVIALCSTAAPLSYSHCRSSCALSLTTHPASEDDFRQIIAKLLKAIPASVTDLDVWWTSALTEGSWTTIVPLLPALETVHIYVNRTAIACLHALQQLETRDPTRQSSPRIRGLVVFNARKPWFDRTAAADDLAGLKDYIKVRSDSGSPLETLEIKDESLFGFW